MAESAELYGLAAGLTGAVASPDPALMPRVIRLRVTQQTVAAVTRGRRAPI